MLSAYQIESLRGFQRHMAHALLDIYGVEVGKSGPWIDDSRRSYEAMLRHAMWRGIGHILAGDLKLAMRDSWLISYYEGKVGHNVTTSDAWQVYRSALETLLFTSEATR